MLLAIDVGNSDTTIGVFEGDHLAGHWRISTERHRTGDEYRLWLRGILGLEGFGREDIDGAALASVVPAATAALRDLTDLVSGPIVVVEPGIRTGMPILIDNPREVGADRLVNALAGASKYGTPTIVVDFGTSTNFDVVSEGGEYVGGVIAPGLEVSLDALVGATARLRNVDLFPPRSPIGKGTVEAIQSGLLYGHSGLVDGILTRIIEELDGSPNVVATGGLASTIVPHCSNVQQVDEFLTLEGLRLIYERNVG